MAAVRTKNPAKKRPARTGTANRLRSLRRELQRAKTLVAAEREERRRVRRRLRSERDLNKAILDTAAALVMVTDAQGAIVQFNRACEQASARAFASVKGKSWELLLPPEELDDARLLFEVLRKGVCPTRYENHWLRPDGTRRLIAWSNTCLFDAKGGVEHVIGTGIDVTEEAQMRREAEHRGSEVAQLARLHASGELAALVAHELNQPLAAIASYAESSRRRLRRGDAVRGAVAENLDLIVQQAERASRTIGELRGFLTKGETDPGPVDLNAVVRDARDLVVGLAARAGIRVRLELADALPPVLGRPLHLEHVLVNLLQNALDALRAAGAAAGLITVRTQREGTKWLQVSVEDNGPGLDAALATKVFEPLYTTKANGLGLGLSICRSLIEGKGGRIWAEPGPGGRFFFSLPVAK